MIKMSLLDKIDNIDLEIVVEISDFLDWNDASDYLISEMEDIITVLKLIKND